MFGYIKADKPEMRVKEFETYKAVYCSLCKELGKSYGFLARLTLSYDFTFLALLNMSLKDGCLNFERKRCAFNPFKKCNYCKENNDLKMPSAAAMIMLYYKLKDNVEDEKGIKKLGFHLLLPIFKGAYKKARKNYPELSEIISDYITEQHKLEEENCSEIDRIADPTAKALSKIFMLCSEEDTEKRILERMGYCMGRYIYILDAACDLEDDIKKSSYNVLKFEYKNNKEQFIKERVVPQLYFCVNEAAKAFELLDCKKFKSILGNIIFSGLEDTFKKELNI
ncbi:MAG: hypothetical protein J6D52_13010 [Clostridia bacterium]|nr:hypothetical protein [Clostridia bacterium]